MSTTYGPLSAALYDVWLPEADPEELNFWMARLPTDDRVVELMCGTGRILVPLAKAGYLIDGVDQSEDMIDRCRKKMVSLSQSSALTVADIYTGARDRRYSAAFLSCGSFQLGHQLRDPAAALSALSRHLTPSGRFYIDLFVPDWSNSSERFVASRLRREAHLSDDLVARCWEEIEIDQENQCETSLLRYELCREAEIVASENETVQLYWFFPDQIVNAAEQAGLIDVTATSGYGSDQAQTLDQHFVLSCTVP